TMPKKTLPISWASCTILWNAAGAIASILAATSTQQPWQRRLQLLMTDTYRNGGNTSPLRSRRLCFSTESIPLRPMFQASFHSRRLSVSNTIRLSMLIYMAGSLFQAGSGIHVRLAFIIIVGKSFHNHHKGFMKWPTGGGALQLRQSQREPTPSFP